MIVAQLCVPPLLTSGFQSLSKTEVKRDTKDIEKNSNFSVSQLDQAA